MLAASRRTMKRSRYATVILVLGAGTRRSSMVAMGYIAQPLHFFRQDNRKPLAALTSQSWQGIRRVSKGATGYWYCGASKPSSRLPGRISRNFATSTDSEEVANKDTRAVILHDRLFTLGIDPEHLASAAHNSIVDPSSGYDPYFGKSAIRAYRTFVSPKGSDNNDDLNEAKLEALASSIARQIEHLAKWHRSREAQWVRHKDVEEGSETNEKPRKSFPLVLVLDNLRSSHNVGSLFRTADASGCHEVITCGITPHPGGGGADKVAKAALGAERTVPTRHFATAAEAVGALRREKAPDTDKDSGERASQEEEGGQWHIAALETTSLSECYSVAPLPGPPPHTLGGCSGTVLILGNEVTGVDPAVLPGLDGVIEIPMFGAKNSLNVAACAPVVLFEALRRWGALEEN